MTYDRDENEIHDRAEAYAMQAEAVVDAGLRRWIAELDRVDDFTLRALLAAAAGQLALRIGNEVASVEIRDLAHDMLMHEKRRQ